MIVFCGVDPDGDLTPRARESLARARVVVTDPAVAALVARHTPTEVRLPSHIDDLLAHAREGVVVRALVATPRFDDAALAEIHAAIEAPVAIEILPGEHDLPLSGRRILVTRAAAQSEGVARSLRRRGAIPILAPTIEIGPPDDPGPLQRAIRDLAPYDVIALTSANAVEALFGALAESSRDARALHRAAIAAIGPGTSAALARHGVRVDVVAEEHRGEALAHAILGLRPVRVLLPRAAIARDALPTILREAGVVVDIVEAYRTRAPTTRRTSIPACDAVTFTSSSTVERFFEIVPDAREVLKDARIASIGPITSETCRSFGLRVDVEAKPYTIPALVDALERSFSVR